MSKVTILTRPNRIVIASKGVQGPPGPEGIQGIQGPKGDTGDVTPEALAARDAAVGAASAAAGSAAAADGAAEARVQALRSDLADPAGGGGLVAYGIDDVSTALDRAPRGPGKPVVHLNIPTWDGDPNVTHPGVLYVPEGFGGYAYWMVHTPFPDDFRELPEILVSNDGHNWGRPRGVQVPLITNAQFTAALGDDYLYNSDPHILRLHDGRLAVYMRPVGGSFGGPFSEWLIRTTTSDGVNWSPIEVCASTTIGTDITYRSPAVVAEADGTYTMWTTGDWPSPPAFHNERNVLRRTSPDGVSWSAPVLCATPGNLRAWHIDVQRTPDGVYHMLVNASSGSQLLYYWISSDGLSWNPGCGQPGTQAIPLIPGVDKTGRYRCAFQPVAGEPGRFHVWLTTVDNTATPIKYRIGAFLPNYPLAGAKDLNVTDSAYRHHGLRFAGLDKADPRSLFIGKDSAVGNSGAQQTAVGELSGYQNTGGQQVAVGSRAGYQNVAQGQTAVGRRAGEANSGRNQVAVGLEAGLSSAGIDQVAVGWQAGRLATGNRQTALGSQSGIEVSAENTTSLGALAKAGHVRSVALGYNTQTTHADQVAVGGRDVEVQSAAKGLVLASPNGTRYRVRVTDAGELTIAVA